MSNLIQTIGGIDSSFDKINLTTLAERHAQQILNNDNVDVLDIYVQIKRYELYIKTLVEQLKQKSTQLASQKKTNRFAYSGAIVSVHNRRKFDFSPDQQWTEINDALSRLQILKKERESLLKGLNGVSKDVLNEETGELEFVHAPRVEGKLGLVVRL